MDMYDDDAQMLDTPGSYSAGTLHMLVEAERPIHGSIPSTSMAAMLAPNGLQDPRQFATSNNGAAYLNPAISRLQEPSRESSVLANNVANHLTIETSEDPMQQGLDNFIDELDDAEHGPTAPYISSLPSGLCYDVRMRYHCELDPPKQSRDFHPEDPRRIFKIYKELCMAGLVNDPMLNTGNLIPNPLLRINARNVSESEVCLVHDKKHWDFMVTTASMASDDLVILERTFDSIYLNVTTFGCALLSAGGAIETCRAVTSRQVKNAIAVIRPPGHHAECNQPMGFCIFDNVSIAAKVCQSDFPETCRKILILDWDVHHGNGIQQAFYQDPNVLYISLHVHEDGNFYPSGNYGDHLHCGGEAGLGKNINIPWPTKGMGDADYMLAFQHIVMPVAYEFDPDLVIIAAGFDAAEGDQLGGCFVTPACYAQMTHMLMSLAQGKLVVCLEGGYNLTSISKSALAVTRTLIGEMPDRIRDTKATETGIETVQMVAMYQSRFWSSLYPKDAHQDIVNKHSAERMHDVIRYYQASQFKENHNMMNVTVYREKLSKSFENQVIATPNFEDAVPLVVIFHDPPELMGTPHPIAHKLELHNTWLADDLKHYVDWAANLGFGVVDVNVPKHLTSTEENEGYGTEDEAERLSVSNELAVYLWENYIDCNDATEIFFFGAGYAYESIIHLLINRGQYSFQTSCFPEASRQLTTSQLLEEDFTRRVTGMVNFISENRLKAVSDHGFFQHGQSLSKWYRANSINFVANNHLVWDIDGSKKPSKRFGNLVRSPVNGLNDMLGQHQEEVQGFITRRVVRRDDDTEEEKMLAQTFVGYRCVKREKERVNKRTKSKQQFKPKKAKAKAKPARFTAYLFAMHITDLANEILLHILQSCPTISSLLAVASTCKHLHSILAHHKLPLLYQSFEAQYGPSHDAIRLVTYNSSQLAHIPRPAPPQSMALLQRLVEAGQVAEKWATVYPSQKWTAEESANRRLLSTAESYKLRRACYRVWLYNIAFHTPQHTRMGRLQPQVVRIRAQVLRPWPAEQLAEMLDLHAIFRAVLHSHICPSNGTVVRRHKQRFPDDPFPLVSATKVARLNNDPLADFHQAFFHSTPHVSRLSMAKNHSQYGATVEGWGDEITQYYVVEDMLKFDPGQLMHLYKSLTGQAGSDAELTAFNSFGSRKATVEHFVAGQGDWFENNGETLVETICFVVGERGGDGRELGELVEGGLEGICRRELVDDVE